MITDKQKKAKTKPKAKKTLTPKASRFADTNFNYMTVYDKDGNDITPK